eukprot:gene4409-14534_t
MDGVNWYCYVVLGLIFITDFTPIGALVRFSAEVSSTQSGAGPGIAAAGWLAAVQWGIFVVPTLYYMKQEKKWDIVKSLRLTKPSVKWILWGIFMVPTLYYMKQEKKWYIAKSLRLTKPSAKWILFGVLVVPTLCYKMQGKKSLRFTKPSVKWILWGIFMVPALYYMKQENKWDVI